MKKIFYLILPILFFGCSEPEKSVVYCNMETTLGDNYVQAFFGKANTQSDKAARSGKFSAVVNKKNQYALDYKINNVKKGDYITVSVWRNSPNEKGALSLVTDENTILQLTNTSTKKENEWEFLEITYLAEKDFVFLKTYVYNPNAELVFFDDLTVSIL